MLEPPALGHSQALHHRTRSSVGNSGERHDLLEPEDLESDPERLAGGLGREALAPVIKGEPPGDLRARRERQRGGGNVQSNETNELTGCLAFDRPDTPTPLGDVSLAAIRQGITLNPGERRREELHHARVGIESGEGRAV